MTIPTETEIDIAASLELNLLNSEGLLPGFEGLVIGGAKVPIGDVAGDLILKRRFLRRGSLIVGFFDIAADGALGAVLLHVGEIGNASPEAGVQPLELRELRELWELAQRKPPVMIAEDHADLREWIPRELCVYALPKLALVVEDTKGKRHFFDLGGWEEIPPLSEEGGKSSTFGYSAILGKAEAGRVAASVSVFKERVGFWNRVAQSVGIHAPLGMIDSVAFKGIRDRLVVRKRCEHIGQPGKCLPPTVVLRSQVNGKWCVPASVLMALSVFQDLSVLGENDIARELGLVDQHGSVTTLPPGGVRKIDDFVDRQKSLEASTDTAPDWPEFEDRLAEGKPIVSLIQGHCRLVAGSSSLEVEAAGSKISMRGLSVLDPWPVGVGRRLLWESFEPYVHEDNVVVMRK